MAITSNLQQNTANQDWASTPCPLRYGEVPNFSNTLLLSRGTLPPINTGRLSMSSWIDVLQLVLAMSLNHKHLGEFDLQVVGVSHSIPKVREGFTKSPPKSNPHFKESLLPQL